MAREADHLLLRIPLLHQAQQLLALDLHSEAQVVEGLRGHDRALQLAGLDRAAADGIGAPAQVLVADARGLLDGLAVQRHHLHLTGGHLAVAVDLELLAGLVDHHVRD
ncbi:hypothetical protein [Delftia sp.]|uniref:hypothetical protein n=1 Tax=Delftia sp. TaxID=1886637 RepID=UPI00259CF55E|nr:hypothetical protein [Delftia sp.]